jgi:uncharacterized protein YndB with AHSA1/START domain
MSAIPGKPHERKVVKEIEVDASPAQVWEAISTAEGLTRWYPLEASVEPGVGGEMTVSWGPGMEGKERIAVWEPGRHLRTFSGAPGAPLPVKGAVPLTLEEWAATNPSGLGPNILDIYLEARGGKTLVRLVHSGFLSGAQWEEEYWDSLEQGWPFMLAGLLHYFKYHPGKPRQVGWPVRTVGVSQMEAWQRLAGPSGLGFQLDSLRPGQRFSLKTAAGLPLEGVVEYVAPPKLRAVVENMNNALLGVMIESCGGPAMAGLWLSAFGVPQAQVDAFRDRWNEVLGRLFPEAAPGNPAVCAEEAK